MSKVGIIVQRYGLEVNGGAEHHSRILAERLNKRHDVTILTTKALDYISWDNHYKNNEEEINGVLVKRFKTNYCRNEKKTGKLKGTILKQRKYQRFLNNFFLIRKLDEKFSILGPTKRQSEQWLNYQGPYCPDLVDYLKINKDKYDCFIFFTYLYYPSAQGLKVVKNKSIFIPTAHDEPEFYAKTYIEVFESAKFIMYNTISEKKLIENTFKNITKFSDIAGVGVEPCELVASDEIIYDFFLYIGRVDLAKGCSDLYDQFVEYKKQYPSDVKLVFVGKNHTDLKGREDIVFTGFVDEDYKNSLLLNSKALIMPSKYESLSMVTLEAMNNGKIVVVNGACEVLKDHIEKSGSGFCYDSDTELCNKLNSILEMPESEQKLHAKNAQKYVLNNYTWDKIINKFDKAIDFIQKQ
ncbi:glycosyltransferase family 4 protein [Aquimarina agarilytica]|uniref:glycosyltransferase family 4 protein n=1 Tax=Aquimarina agarilytica TaxID=1087449 RepID=UPI000289101F|nr:glycosyltransferase family 4 protein [Aquimarina agarilytica]